ncbi:MAG: hypothetical protein GC152_10155 [Alphaproteobacteria bacterium]|nr:hypothetical protein [Alphaproteobacteria bacterium]
MASTGEAKTDADFAGRWMRAKYFSWISAITLGLSVWGFSDNLFWNVRQPSNGDPKFIVHGLFCLAWMAVFFAQANLIRNGDVSAHRRLGVAGLLAAIGVTASTIFVFAAVWKGWDAMTTLVRANRILLPSYAAFVAAAFANRGRPDRHKRLMLLGTLFMMEPILSRAFDPLEPLFARLPAVYVDVGWWIFFVAVWSGLFASLVAYDWLTDRRIHAVTLVGIGWFSAIWMIVNAT